MQMREGKKDLQCVSHGKDLFFTDVFPVPSPDGSVQETKIEEMQGKNGDSICEFHQTDK